MVVSFSRLSMSDSSSENDESDRLMEKAGSVESLLPPTRNNVEKVFTWGRLYSLVLHIVFAGLIVALWMSRQQSSYAAALRGRSWSPAARYVEYEVNADHPTDYHGVNKYAGPPNAAQDAAWDALIRPVFFNASAEELQKAGESFENIAELTGGGYPASLGAYHELHCVRQLRFWIYRDYYYPNLTKAEGEYLHTHLDHCTETLRLAIMCHGDTGVHSFSWTDPKAPHPMSKTSSKLACVKWSSIDDYARSRMIPTHPSLIHP
ncbi:hypothetical protein GGI35DRAFT_478691 [Trichoderma velutinum]